MSTLGKIEAKAKRLNNTTLKHLPAAVERFAYDRSRLVPGIVHIGIGAFHRAHMAQYIDSLLENDPTWAIVGASLRRPDTREALQPQEYLYSLTTRDSAESSSRIIGSVIGIIDASQGPHALINQMASPGIRIVSLTITEKGYCHEPGSGKLQLAHPDIVHDLANRHSPRSVPGIIVAALEERRARGLGGFTVLSCDNLQGNGRIIRRAVLDFARLHDASLAEWISENVSFPSTMVDRIVPSTMPDDLGRIADELTYEDAWPVISEPFTQWVVEDNFIAGRPALDSVGVQIVQDVEPFERMKLRMLNGSHSVISYLGLLMGKSFVAEVVAEPGVRQFLRQLMLTEVAPTLPLPMSELELYADQLLERFSNTALRHRCAQIATDGSQKIPQRILAPISERLARGESVRLLSLSVAAWAIYLRKCAEGKFELSDPMAEHLIRIVGARGKDNATIARDLLSVEIISGSFLHSKSGLISQVTQYMDAMGDASKIDAVVDQAAREGTV